ncbi:hypothetical protein TVAG_183160 [Trichomonas vaginalis G3]|uniref:Uncharacterized protein n=1 Tax=Trichomonas vaginalis (strain ATCC PRA-98 / G3) TaxID=412133 RepID=A2D954_TRIV3|nr:hypothetical protein TVAGG3_0529780 [Trichomonas vaginalis G3]EAY23080.1 hypothetical protein TVAG_183160 [Trichomonas vaginalis G3]KAI5519048.1 hypothetical protein TVAGG3_0529780 [Trichomonas vaginalis G3]|eukprot:XP_001584066.1 hypothetical protein [Trichomonas vaginalis G3]
MENEKKPKFKASSNYKRAKPQKDMDKMRPKDSARPIPTSLSSTKPVLGNLYRPPPLQKKQYVMEYKDLQIFEQQIKESEKLVNQFSMLVKTIKLPGYYIAGLNLNDDQNEMIIDLIKEEIRNMNKNLDDGH